MSRPDVRDERKTQILDAAARVFARKGLAEARMEDIAGEARLSIGGVYWYYKSKNEVVHDLMARFIDPDLAGLRTLLKAEGTVQDRLSGYLHTWAAPTEAMLPLTYEFYSLAGRDEQARAHIHAYLNAYQEILAELIRQGIQRGEFRQVNVESAAALLAAMYEGMFELRMIAGQGFDVETRLKEAYDLIVVGLKEK